MKITFKEISRELVIERTDAMKPFSGRNETLQWTQGYNR